MTSGTNTCYVLANQAGNTDYAAAPQVSIAVTAVLAPTATGVGIQPESIELWPSRQLYGDGDGGRDWNGAVLC